ncbi:MAG: hypothetical protein ACYTGZ_04530 [Planctomycetota bacterium]|jgi:hypothetical protein
MPVVVAILLLLAPEKADSKKAYKLEYSFRKGDEYKDETTRSFKMEKIQGKSLATWDVSSKEVFERKVMETKENRPDIERIIVRDFTREVRKSPMQKEVGKITNGAVGATFVWRRVGERWGLFGQRSELTDRHPEIVNRLKNWRDARLPVRPVKIGETWSVDAKTFRETAGQPVPPGTAGSIDFTLKAVDKNGVATIEFKGTWAYRTPGSRYVVKQTGKWLFDAKRGRDLEFSTKGKLDITGADEGSGDLAMKRVVTWKAPRKG